MWKLKVLIQFVLSHIPWGERVNHLLQRLNTKRKGGNRLESEQRLPDLCASFKLLRQHTPLEDAVVVEVGTGWCPIPTVLLSLCGARRVYTYDHVRHMRFDLTYNMLEVIEEHIDEVAGRLGLPVAEIAGRLAGLKKCTNLDELLQYANIEYVAPGDAANTKLPDRSVDLYFSHAVLEHVPDQVVNKLVREAKRVLKPTGCFHALIGLGDHYASADRSVSMVNFLQYPEWMWRLFVKNNISYHNRMREMEFVEALTRQGARLRQVISTTEPGDVERVKAMKIDSRFERFTPEECAVCRTEIVASFAVDSGGKHDRAFREEAGVQSDSQQ